MLFATTVLRTCGKSCGTAILSVLYHFSQRCFALAAKAAEQLFFAFALFPGTAITVRRKTGSAGDGERERKPC
jgi:hypothetical protein